MIVLNICYVMFLSGAIKYWIAWTNAKEKLQSFCRARIGREKDEEKKEGIERWGYLYETALFLRKRKEEEQCEQKRGTAGGRKKTETRQVRFSCIETVLFFFPRTTTSFHRNNDLSPSNCDHLLDPVFYPFQSWTETLQDPPALRSIQHNCPSWPFHC